MSEQIDLMEQISKLTRMVRRHPTGKHISRGDHRVIEILLENDGMRATDLAEKLDIRPPSLTDVLKKLEDKGYIRREQDQQDSRVYRVYATDRAKSEWIERRDESQRQRARLHACLTNEEAEEFCRICNKLCVFFEQEYGADECHRHGKDHKHGRGHGRHHDFDHHGRHHESGEKSPDCDCSGESGD